jgi:hypothetical protein
MVLWWRLVLTSGSGYGLLGYLIQFALHTLVDQRQWYQEQCWSGHSTHRISSLHRVLTYSGDTILPLRSLTTLNAKSRNVSLPVLPQRLAQVSLESLPWQWLHHNHYPIVTGSGFHPLTKIPHYCLTTNLYLAVTLLKIIGRTRPIPNLRGAITWTPSSPYCKPLHKERLPVCVKLLPYVTVEL